MKLVRQVIAVFLSFFLASPAWASEKKSDPKKESDYHFFKLGVRPIDSSRNVNWEKECVVVINAHSPKIRLQYKKSDGSIGVSNWGNVRKGEEVIVDGKTGYALRLRICGNGVVEPTNWEPIGEELCREEESPVMEKPAPVVAEKELEVAPEPAPVKKLNLKVEEPAPEPAPVTAKAPDKPKKKSKTWLYILGGIVLGGAAVALAGSGGSESSGGGPAKDPRN